VACPPTASMWPLAFAQKMAEETDGLVLPYLAYFFPGDGRSARSRLSAQSSARSTRHDLKGIMQALRGDDNFTKEVIPPKYENILPK